MAGNQGNGSKQVRIYGRTYHLRSDGEQNLEELAALLDGKMKEVARHTDTADTLKVAIMAALNIASDHREARRGRDPAPSGEAQSRLSRMVTVLDEALAEQ